ncbi:alpha/beta hydrolase [Sediminibacterium goheungense]|uniref:Putative alpha/beta superfamily hydrolase n=1 Tax=Sediminibacterium goheungense TaxID=1086393 RepID=A0A4R6IYS7_9BACT|nr:alpha/beta hydrolase-fold protein [Sediminibacterium goheungense]TDO28022.1 putative alpha/beta superfamily hydrolase [Sediminibacterium goheungense]
MKRFITACAFLLTIQTQAQFSVRLIVNTVATKANDDIYVSGNFNNWNPKDENYKLKPFGGSRRSIVLKNMAPGTYAFKFTRGGFDKVETLSDGRDIADRVLEVNNDLSLEFDIPGWKDEYPDKPKRYSASPQVRIIDTAFSIPQLNRKRKIWIYLPKGYTTSGKNYPVLYMQDGQNLFNDQTAFAGEWGVDECLDTLQQKLKKECIVVGIDHAGDKRMNEYNPWDHPQFGKGEGKAYAEFLAKTLKPYIDSKYRTYKSAENNFVLGSSMGGLISLYTVLQYPDVFGGAGVFSPSFQLSNDIYQLAKGFTTTSMPAFYLYTGSKEASNAVPNLQKMSDILQKKQRFIIRTVINPLGQHNETYWKQEFGDFYKWMSTIWK